MLSRSLPRLAIVLALCPLAGPARAATPGVCFPDATTLCIDGAPGDRRFRVRAAWQTAQGGGAAGDARALSTAPVGVTSGGLFWFFSAANPEILVKILEGCAVNGQRWAFTSAGTNVGLAITMTDMQTGEERVYTNPDLTPAAPVQDVAALGCTDPCAGQPTLTAGNTGPACVGGSVTLTAGAVPGALYSWTGPNGFSSVAQSPVLSGLTAAAAGTYAVTAISGVCVSSATTTLAVTGTEAPTATITAPATVAPFSAGNVASVPALPGATYSWTALNGSVTGSATGNAVTFTAGWSGSVELTCTVTRAFCTATGTRSVGIGSYEVTLTPSPGPIAPAGSAVTFTAQASGAGPFEYRFWRGPDATSLRIVRDFAATNTFTVTANDAGTYGMRAEARMPGAGPASSSPVVTEAVTFAGASPTLVLAPEHPLVARYVAPGQACQGTGMRVEFRPAGSSEAWQTTPLRPCTGSAMGFFVAGMKPSTAYDVRHVTSGPPGTASPALRVTTGPLPGNLVVPDTQVTAGPTGASTADRVLFLSAFPPDSKPLPHAVDLAGRVIWFDPTWNDAVHIATTFTSDGTLLLLVADQGFQGQILREIDLAGNTVREGSVARIREQVQLPPDHYLGAFDHEAIRFPDGHTLVQVSHEVLFRNGPGPVDDENVLGTMVVALDPDWQVGWTWNSFDHLSVARKATTQPAVCANSTSGSGLPGCPPIFLPLDKPADLRVAQDWLHGNAIARSPADKNFTYSLRHQDWVLKIRYMDGAGDGALLWKLGPEGSFTTSSPDPFPWNTHQHGAVFVDGTTMSLFDNGNLRCQGQTDCKSRGQVWALSEETTPKTATLQLNVPIGYSPALGASQRLSNGSFHYTSGAQTTADQPPQAFTESVEVTPQGNVALVLRTAASCYRSYRMPSLYSHEITGAPARP